MTTALSRRASLKTIAAAAAFPAAAHAASGGVAAPAIKLVVLDVGGTIIQDHGEVPQAMQSALGHGGVRASLAEINDWRGASKREMVRHFVELRTKPDVKRADLIEAIYGDFSAQVNKAYAKVQPIAGAVDAIRAMRKRLPSRRIRGNRAVWPTKPGPLAIISNDGGRLRYS
jgi:beta-phosphoglucomutase-like phosphatase (HAD superfamily)